MVAGYFAAKEQELNATAEALKGYFEAQTQKVNRLYEIRTKELQSMFNTATLQEQLDDLGETVRRWRTPTSQHL
jgi:hypothetical protein